jgi:hypothetical protein
VTRKDQGFIRFFKPPDLPYVQAVYGTDVINEYHRHAYSGFCIGIVRKGARVLYSNGASTVIHENDLFVINPGQAHACKSLDGMHSYFVVSVKPERMRDIASQISEKAREIPHFNKTFVHDKKLSLKISRFFSVIESSSVMLERETVLNSFLSDLILHYGDGPPVPRDCGAHGSSIKAACEFMRVHYAEDLSVSQLSKIACLSPFYFQRMFLKETGLSPHEYLVNFRLKKARELLIRGSGIAETAYDAGFVVGGHPKCAGYGHF